MVIAYPALGPVYVLKKDISDKFYFIRKRPLDMPKMGLVSP